MSYVLRLMGFDAEADMELSALQLFAAAGRIDQSGVLTSSHVPVSGALESLQSDDLALTCRFAKADVRSPGFFIDFTFDSAVEIDAIRLGVVAPLHTPTRITICIAGNVIWDINGINVSAPGLTALLDRGDPHLVKVPVLLWPNGSGVVERSPNSSRTWAVQGSVSDVASAEAADGRTFRFAAGAGSYLSTPATADLNLSTSWTIEMRFKTSKTGDLVLLDKWYSGATWQLMLIGGQLGFYASGYYYLDGKHLADGQYHDIVVQRDGNALIGFVDGDRALSLPLNSSIDSTSVALSVGAQVASRNPAYDFVGDIDYLRITNGVARYSDSFVPLKKIPLAGGGGLLQAPRLKTRVANIFTAVADAESLSEMPTYDCGVDRLRDVEFGGWGFFYGKVKDHEANLLQRRVRLFRSRDGYLVRETWSAKDGTFRFGEINERYEYDIEAWDHEKNYFTVVANNQLPEVAP